MSIADRIAPRLPRHLTEHLRLDLVVVSAPVGPGVARLRAWVALTLDIEVCEFTARFLPLPGAKLVEQWDPDREPWFAYHEEGAA